MAGTRHPFGLIPWATNARAHGVERVKRLCGVWVCSTATVLGSHCTISHNTSHRTLRKSFAQRFLRNTHNFVSDDKKLTANNVTMATTTTRMLLLLGLSFLSTASVASGYACTYRGQGVSSCSLEEAQDVWLESSSRN